nr:hypothetical protein [Tanacetum cinerariifolium]
MGYEHPSITPETESNEVTESNVENLLPIPSKCEVTLELAEESAKNSSEENVVLKTNQEPPQDSDIHQLIEECSIEVPEEQKQKMEDTMFDLVKICHYK